MKKNKTMSEVYGEPNDESGKHICCSKCSMCIDCGDCKQYGCGKTYVKQKRSIAK